MSRGGIRVTVKHKIPIHSLRRKTAMWRCIQMNWSITLTSLILLSVYSILCKTMVIVRCCPTCHGYTVGDLLSDSTKCFHLRLETKYNLQSRLSLRNQGGVVMQSTRWILCLRHANRSATVICVRFPCPRCYPRHFIQERKKDQPLRIAVAIRSTSHLKKMSTLPSIGILTIRIPKDTGKWIKRNASNWKHMCATY